MAVERSDWSAVSRQGYTPAEQRRILDLIDSYGDLYDSISDLLADYRAHDTRHWSQ